LAACMALQGAATVRLVCKQHTGVYRTGSSVARNRDELGRALARQEAAAVQLVREQLAAFRSEMERDGAAQRAQARRLITGAAQRAARLVDSTLQVGL